MVMALKMAMMATAMEALMPTDSEISRGSATP